MVEIAMTEIKLGGEISLIGFGSLEPMELIVVKKIVGNYIRKLSTQVNYNSLRLELKQHHKGKSFMHEINAQLSADGSLFGANLTDWNLYVCLTNLLDKVLIEALHKKRSDKERGENMLEKEEKEAEKEEQALQMEERKEDVA